MLLFDIVVHSYFLKLAGKQKLKQLKKRGIANL